MCRIVNVVEAEGAALVGGDAPSDASRARTAAATRGRVRCTGGTSDARASAGTPAARSLLIQAARGSDGGTVGAGREPAYCRTSRLSTRSGPRRQASLLGSRAPATADRLSPTVGRRRHDDPPVSDREGATATLLAWTSAGTTPLPCRPRWRNGSRALPRTSAPPPPRPRVRSCASHPPAAARRRRSWRAWRGSWRPGSPRRRSRRSPSTRAPQRSSASGWRPRWSRWRSGGRRGPAR